MLYNRHQKEYIKCVRNGVIQRKQELHSWLCGKKKRSARLLRKMGHIRIDCVHFPVPYNFSLISLLWTFIYAPGCVHGSRVLLGLPFGLKTLSTIEQILLCDI